MANENFLRTYTMRCGKRGKKGFEIGNTKNNTDPVLHVSFSIEKSETESPNTAKVQVWNLSPKSLKILDLKDCVLELKAGYGDNRPLVLLGDISSVITTPEDADRMTEIEVVDGMVALRNGTVSVSFNGNVNAKKVYRKFAKALGIPIVFAKGLKFKNIPNGFSFVGKARVGLKKLARMCGHSWSIQNGILQVTKKGGSISTKGYLLNEDTGLVGVPKRITISTSTKSKKTQTGWEIQYFLNGAIGVNDIVKIQSKECNGYFLVKKVTMDGDNYEGDWVCTAQVIKIKK